MTVGERIKLRRKELGLSVDQLADMLGKNRATVYRYESDEIENLSITVLEPLAKALKTSPPFLMGWGDETIEVEVVNKEDTLLRELTTYFYLLNNTGMEEAIKRIKELSFIPSYCKNEVKNYADSSSIHSS